MKNYYNLQSTGYEWTIWKLRTSAVFSPNNRWQVPIINVTESVGNNAPSYS